MQKVTWNATVIWRANPWIHCQEPSHIVWTTINMRVFVMSDTKFVNANLVHFKTPTLLGLFLAGSTTTSVAVLCICVPISWAREKQTAVSHSSTDVEVRSLDIGFCNVCEILSLTCLNFFPFEQRVTLSHRHWLAHAHHVVKLLDFARFG